MIVVGNTLALAHLRRAVASYLQRVDPDTVPDDLVALVALVAELDALSRQSTSHPAGMVVPRGTVPHGGLMTFQQVADRLAVSRRTVSRMVASGQLRTVGRRIPADALDTLGRG